MFFGLEFKPLEDGFARPQQVTLRTLEAGFDNAEYFGKSEEDEGKVEEDCTR